MSDTETTDVPMATCTVHWPNGPVNVCEDHATDLVGLGRFLGSHIAVTTYDGGEPCINCVNAKKR